MIKDRNGNVTPKNSETVSASKFTLDRILRILISSADLFLDLKSGKYGAQENNFLLQPKNESSKYYGQQERAHWDFSGHVKIF